VAQKITEFLNGFDRFAKTIIFCADIDHAERLRSAIANHSAELVAENHKYVMQITGDNDEGKKELDNFIDPEEKYPVIATTSELMTTGVDAQTCKVIVLDSEIKSMTKFKQIIGRGTRINEDFDKRYFTILDFRNVTDLFADKDFDGDPIRIKPVSQNDDLSQIVQEEEKDETTIFDDLTGEKIEFKKPSYLEDDKELPTFEDSGPKPPPIPREKIIINDVDVSVLEIREQYVDPINGKLITTSLKDHTRAIVKGQFSSLNNFLNEWNTTERNEAIIAELRKQGVLVDALIGAVNREVDLFDLICHVAFDQPPLTRKERANNVKKRNYFTKYGEQARKVLETLLDKYADEGIANIETIDALKVKPLDDFGSPMEIVKLFGSKGKYLSAVKELKLELYKIA
jgi:type I restriction enzyme R subunit